MKGNFFFKGLIFFGSWKPFVRNLQNELIKQLGALQRILTWVFMEDNRWAYLAVFSINYNRRVESQLMCVSSWLSMLYMFINVLTSRMAPRSVLNYNDENALKKVINKSMEI